MEEQMEKLEQIEEKKPILSQRDYVPTPFALSEWELVGERLTDLDFSPMELAIIRSRSCNPDPMFEDFGSPLPRESESILHSRDKKLHQDEPEAPLIDEAVIAEEKAKSFEEGRAAGVREGEESAKALMEARFEELQGRFKELGDAIHNEVQTTLARVEKNAVALALQIARKILVTTADIKPEYIIDVIRQAMQSAGAGKPVRIRVAPADHEFLEVIGLPAELSTEETGVNYVSDENVRSGCVVETDFGEVDLQLEKMWEQIRESLYEASK